jgi:16S rRNA (guanine966-N2)-methyltransferase
VREAIFNLLRDRVEGARVLDLFGGSGALGIEALSRGAVLAVFVDSAVSARRTIRENLAALELEGRGRVLGGGTENAIGSLSEKGETFDVIFADPPYGRGIAEETLTAISRCNLLENGGAFVVECSKREELDDRYGSLRLKADKLYGDTRILVFEMSPTVRG